MENYLDEKLATVFHDVPIPVGLAQRLLDRLATERERESAESAARQEDRKAAVSSRLAAALSRRWLLTGGGLLAVAAALLIAVWLGARHARGLSEESVADEAIQAFDSAIEHKGYLLAEHAPPTGYPISASVIQVRGMSWRAVETLLGREGVVYEFPGRAGARAALYVLAAGDAEHLGTSPALNPFTTGGYCASAWQEGGLLYVLVVRGGPTAYSGYLNLPSEPMA
jgi:hypothetical protein